MILEPLHASQAPSIERLTHEVVNRGRVLARERGDVRVINRIGDRLQPSPHATPRSGLQGFLIMPLALRKHGVAILDQ
jgi:hypothetical protein